MNGEALQPMQQCRRQRQLLERVDMTKMMVYAEYVLRLNGGSHMPQTAKRVLGYWIG